jgi:hypothetical protein
MRVQQVARAERRQALAMRRSGCQQQGDGQPQRARCIHPALLRLVSIRATLPADRGGKAAKPGQYAAGA